MSETPADQLRREVEAVPFWWHSIDLGGVVTPGQKGRSGEEDGATYMRRELEALRLPALAGKTVLDIGAWDGYYAFEAERRGARRIVALDHYVWSIDWARAAQGVGPHHEKPEVWRPQELPGKRGFDLAKRELASSVEPIVADFMTIDLDSLGSFDVVLFLGVLYHLQDHFAALRRLARVTREVAVIESEAAIFPGFEQTALCEFFESDERAGDPTNWWAPNLRALEGMCRAAGFARVTVVQGPPEEAATITTHSDPIRYRAIVHAHAGEHRA